MQKKICAMIGLNPDSFSYGLNEDDDRCIALKLKLLQQISILYENGIHVFLSNCALGVNMWAAEIVAGLMCIHPNIELICVIPYEEQAVKWPAEYRDRYFSLHEECTQSILFNTAYRKDCLIECGRYLVNESDILLAVCDEQNLHLSMAGQMVAYAKQVKRDLILIHPVTLAVTDAIIAV